MQIGELARRTGTEIDTVRYYEKAGLMPVPPRQGNGYRAYGERHVECLAFIRHCRALDIPLNDIKRLLDFVAHPETNCGDINRLIDDQLTRVRERLSSMQALEGQLVTLRALCNENHAARECGILHELVATAHGEACACSLAAMQPRIQAPADTPPRPAEQASQEKPVWMHNLRRN